MLQGGHGQPFAAVPSQHNDRRPLPPGEIGQPRQHAAFRQIGTEQNRIVLALLQHLLRFRVRTRFRYPTAQAPAEPEQGANQLALRRLIVKDKDLEVPLLHGDPSLFPAYRSVGHRSSIPA
jgi:hypothetical protein